MFDYKEMRESERGNPRLNGTQNRTSVSIIVVDRETEDPVTKVLSDDPGDASCNDEATRR